MKRNRIQITEGIKKGARAGFLLIVVAILTLEVTGIIQFVYSAKGIKEEAQKRAETTAFSGCPSALFRTIPW